MSKAHPRPRLDKARGRAPALSEAFPRQPSGRRDPTAMTADQWREIQELIDLLKQSDLAELEVERDGFRIRLRRDSIPTAGLTMTPERMATNQEVSVESTPLSGSTQRTTTITIRSPIVGTFYRSPSPDADPYVEEGDFVRKGQVLCIVEAMKLMNEIESEVDGRVVKILVESTKPVEYGQPLFLIEPSPAP